MRKNWYVVHLNCKEHEMKVNKTKNEEFLDKSKQYFIHLLNSYDL
jgi:hypothetical protein